MNEIAPPENFQTFYEVNPVDVGAALAEAHRHLEELLKIERDMQVVVAEGEGNLAKAIENALARSLLFEKELLRQATAITS